MMKFTAEQEKLIRKDLNAKIIPWRGTLYHGSPLLGIACVLEKGFVATSEMQSMGGDLFSTSANSRVIELFGDDGANGFRFLVDFDKVLVLSNFWYDVFNSWSGSGASGWDESVEDDPRLEQKAIRLGVDVDAYAEVSFFLDEFLDKKVQAIMIPGFNDTHQNSEREIAITKTGIKRLKSSVTAVFIDYQEYTWDEAKEVLHEMGVEPEECYS